MAAEIFRDECLRRLEGRIRRVAPAALSAALVFLPSAFSVKAQEPAALLVEKQIPGIAVQASGGIAETTGEIMARHIRTAAAPQKTLDFFRGRPDTSQKKVDPDAASRLQGPAKGPQSPEISSGRGPLAPQVIGVTGDSPPSGSLPCGTPPDTMGAIGPTQFIVFENCNIVTYSKATGVADGVLSTTPDNFFTSIKTPDYSTSDSHVRYDRTSQRWFLVMIDVAFPDNRVLLAVSDSATITPSTVWHFFFFQSGIGTHTSCLADFPVPGIDANGIYIGVNQFCGPDLISASYAGSDIFVVQKSSVLGAGPIQVTGFPSSGFGTYPWAPHGVDNSDPAATEGYLIGVNNASWSQLDLIRVSSPGGTSPTLSLPVGILTANQGTPIPQPHLGMTGGSTHEIDGGENTLLAATFRDGSLWTAMNVGVTVNKGACVGVATGVADRDAVFWWEIQGIPTGMIPSIRQAGIVCDTASSNPNFYSYGTIAPSGQGHAAAGFSIAGINTHIGGATAGRFFGDTLSTLQSIDIFSPGLAAYNPTFDPRANGFTRWGDFSFTSLDPCNDMSLWTIQEFVPVANQYGTHFAELKGPPPAAPASASPPSVAAGQASVGVVITGTSSSGSGFYDTPSSMSSEPCRTRLAAAVSGGVTVNGVTYTDPTHVTLNLNTTSATTGAKNVTVTNPDGQFASGSGILTITTSGCTPPATPVITAPSIAGAGSPNRTASVALHAGSSYAWTIGNGTITAGNGTSQVTFTAGTAGTLTLGVIETDSLGCASAQGSANVTVAPAGSALQFYTVTPCRVADTRTGSGFPSGYGSPSIGGGVSRDFVVAGQCGIPADARAVSFNFTVWNTTSYGDFRIQAKGGAASTVSTLNWGPGILALANAAIIPLGATGAITVVNEGSGTVDLFFDVDGYFQ